VWSEYNLIFVTFTNFSKEEFLYRRWISLVVDYLRITAEKLYYKSVSQSVRRDSPALIRVSVICIWLSFYVDDTSSSRVRSLALSRRRAIIIASNFEKLPRAWFCSDQRQISAENRTAHAVHCQKEIFEFLKKMNNLLHC
jgi:hypothetical protein